jgi:hypothetical protein
MNIFVLDADPLVAAKYHNDRHVVKMILESAQLLSNAHHMLNEHTTGGRRPVRGLLRPANVRHPCAIWARSSTGAYRWLHALMGGLLVEFAARYGRQHVYGYPPKASLYTRLAAEPLGLPDQPAPAFAQAMPLHYRRPDPVQAYRLYYFYEKSHLACWRAPSSVPDWWDELGVTEIRRLMKIRLTQQGARAHESSLLHIPSDPLPERSA